MKNIKTKTHLSYIALILALIISSCTPSQSEQSAFSTAEASPPAVNENASSITPRQAETTGCIPPLADFSYLTRDKNKPIPGYDFSVLPSPPWTSESEIIDTEARNADGNETLIARSINNEIEIWTGSSQEEESPIKAEGNFWVYTSTSEEWRKVSRFAEEDEDVYFSELHLAEDGALWAINNWDNNKSGGINKPVLSRYNKTLRRFYFEEESKGIPSGGLSLLGNDGLFWFLVPKDAIYSYNSVTHKVDRYSDLHAEYIQSAVISFDGNIYFIEVSLNSAGLPRWDILVFNTNTHEIAPIDLTYSVLDSPYADPSNLLSDNSGRIWLGGLGWKDPNSDLWHRLHPNPVFITNASESPYTFWQNPEIIFESSDGRLWFRSSNGMVWLDLEVGRWCWFTTYKSNIVEDSDHNLWMIADGKLYKYALGV